MGHRLILLFFCLVIGLFIFPVSCEKPEAPPDVPENPIDTIPNPPNDTPLVSFTITNNNCIAACKITFTNTSVNTDFHKWDFGDGSAVSIDLNPSHTYSRGGVYNVTLTGTTNGHTVIVTQPVEINRPVIPYSIGTSSSESGTGVVQMEDGGYVVTGYTYVQDNSYNVYLLKTDASRNVIWEKNFGGSGTDLGHGLGKTNDGGFIIIGENRSVSGNKDIYLIRTDAEGNLLWEKTFGGIVEDAGYGVTQTSDNGFLLTGVTRTPGIEFTDLIVIKTDDSGTLLWEKRMGSAHSDGGYAVTETSDGNYVVGGFSGAYVTSLYSYMIKMDPQGNVIWEQHTAAWCYLYSVQETSDGNLIWAGTDGGSTSHCHGSMVKTDANGALIWNKTYFSPGVLHNNVKCGRQTLDGGYILCGSADLSGYQNTNLDAFMIIKTDADGNIVWEKYFSGNLKKGIGYDVRQTSDGGYIVVGEMKIQSGDFDIYLLKLDADGNVQ